MATQVSGLVRQTADYSNRNEQYHSNIGHTLIRKVRDNLEVVATGLALSYIGCCIYTGDLDFVAPVGFGILVLQLRKIDETAKVAGKIIGMHLSVSRRPQRKGR